nr:hypothetical protein GCM10010200_061640 [Actinomadura rugatobispora]
MVGGVVHALGALVAGRDDAAGAAVGGAGGLDRVLVVVALWLVGQEALAVLEDRAVLGCELFACEVGWVSMRVIK